MKQGTNYGLLLLPAAPTVQGLGGAYGLALSPDGGYLYITGVNSNSLTVLTRDLISGSLSYGSLTHIGRMWYRRRSPATNLNGAYGITLSPDGKNIYVANYGD